MHPGGPPAPNAMTMLTRTTRESRRAGATPTGARLAAAILAAAILAGCAKQPPPAPKNQPTRITIRGGGANTVVEVKQAPVLKQTDLLVYPGSRVVSDSEYCAVASHSGEKTYRARLRTSAGFGDVVKWYCKRLGDEPVSAKIGETRMAVIAGKLHGSPDTISVLVTRRGTTTDINIMRLVEGK